MHILIVEDNAFNAFCLSGLLQATHQRITISVVSNSVNALEFLKKHSPFLIILDGDLRAHDELHCNGPALADSIWTLNPRASIIAWTDSDLMRQAFAKTFNQHNKPFTEHHCWTKIVSRERIIQSLSHILKDQNQDMTEIRLENAGHSEENRSLICN